MRLIYNLFISYFWFLFQRLQVFFKKYRKFFPLLFFIVVNVIWIVSDHSTPFWDESRHTLNSLKILDVFKHLGEVPIYTGLVWFYDFYTHLTYIVASLFHIIFGQSYDSACLSVTFIWLPLLYFSTYGIGKILFFGDETRSILSAFLVCSFPIVLSLGKIFLIDLPGLAVVTFTFYIFLKTNFLISKGSWKWVGISVILSFFVKANTLLFIAWLYIFALIRGIKKYYRGYIDGLNFLHNLVLSVVVGVGGILVWLLPFLGGFMRDMKAVSYTAGVMEGDPPPFSLPSILYYPTAFLNSYLFLPLLIFFILGTTFMLIKRDRKNILLFGYFIIPYIWMTFFTYNKDIRYLVGILSVVSIIIAYPFDRNFLRKIWGKLLFLILIFISLWNTFSINFGNLLKMPELKVAGINVFSNSGFITSSPRYQYEANFPEIIVKSLSLLDKIKKVFYNQQEPLTLLLKLEDDPFLNYWNFNLNCKLYNLNYFEFSVDETKKLDIAVLSGKNIELTNKLKGVLIYEGKLFSGKPFVIYGDEKYRDWILCYDQMLNNVIAFKFNSVKIKDKVLVLDFVWLSDKRTYGDIGDIDAEIYFISPISYATNKIYIPNFIYPGGDGGVGLAKKIDLKNYNFTDKDKIYLSLKNVYVDDRYVIPYIIFGQEVRRNVRKLKVLSSVYGVDDYIRLR